MEGLDELPMSGMNDHERPAAATGYFSRRPSPIRIVLAVLATGGIMVAAYLVAALVLAAIIGAVPNMALTGWFPWTIAIVQAVPLYVGAWLAGAIGTRIAASAPMGPGWIRVATVMALPVLITIALSATSSRQAWFATAIAIVVVAAGAFLGAIRRAA